MNIRSKVSFWGILLVVTSLLTGVNVVLLGLVWRLPLGYPTEAPYERTASAVTTHTRENLVDGQDLATGFQVLDAILEARLSDAVGSDQTRVLAPSPALRAAVTTSASPAPADVHTWLAAWTAALQGAGVQGSSPRSPTSSPSTSGPP